jgi:cell wall-associated NlpC family hydrolase
VVTRAPAGGTAGGAVGVAVAGSLGGLIALVALVAAVVLALASMIVTGPDAGGPGAAGGGSGAAGGPVAAGDIPPELLGFYVAAAGICPGLDWSVLAAIGKIESDHGRSNLPGVKSGANAFSAEGPMQFLPSTWTAVVAAHPVPGSPSPNIYDPHDAIFTAAAYLCSNGAGNPATLSRAIFQYNHSAAYVAQVLDQARRYAAQAVSGNDRAPAGSTGRTAAGGGNRSLVAAALSFARAQIGRPYVWGGNGPGFDCSGLTHAAYAAAGVELPRTAATQFAIGPRLPPSAPLQPGDLVFYGAPVSHVVLYIGDDQVIQAQQPGTRIGIWPLARTGYVGATRPAPTSMNNPTNDQQSATGDGQFMALNNNRLSPDPGRNADGLLTTTPIDSFGAFTYPADSAFGVASRRSATETAQPSVSFRYEPDPNATQTPQVAKRTVVTGISVVSVRTVVVSGSGPEPPEPPEQVEPPEPPRALDSATPPRRRHHR